MLGSGYSTPTLDGISTAKSYDGLFTVTKPEVDGEDCLHDCESCTAHYPAKFSIDESDKLYGHVKGWNTHLIVGTGKTDWVRDVADEKGSVMEAVGKVGLMQKNGKVMLSASNMPCNLDHDVSGDGSSDCLLLPAWTIIERVMPKDVGELMEKVIGQSVTNDSRIASIAHPHPHLNGAGEGVTNGTEEEKKENNDGVPEISGLKLSETGSSDVMTTSIPKGLAPKFSMKQCPHRALILMCSQKTRDARCGQSAPILRKEFERQLRPLGLYRDYHDERPGGVGVYYISHVGGHKYSANVMVYRREGRKKEGTDEEIDGTALCSEAVQGIWLARVRPEDCENIVKYTVLQGKVVKPQRQLRGGFDREQGLISW